MKKLLLNEGEEVRLVPGETTVFSPISWCQDVAVHRSDGTTVATGKIATNLPGDPPPPGPYMASVDAGPIVGVSWLEEDFASPEKAAEWVLDYVIREDSINRYHARHGHPIYAPLLVAP